MNEAFKILFRNAAKQPAYAFIHISGLAVGLACFILIALWVRYERSYDRFHTNSDRLYRVAFTNEAGDSHGYWQTGTLAGYLEEEFPEIIHATSFKEGQCKIAFEDRGFYCMGSYADPAFFSMFTFPFVQGDSISALKRPGFVVITKSLSIKLFGTDDPVGKPVKINETLRYTVGAVIGDIPANSSLNFDLLMPFSDAQDWMKTWDSKWTQTYVMLQHEDQVETVNRKIKGVLDRFQPAWKNTLYLVPLAESHLHALKGGGLIVYIRVFTGMAVIVLLLACINFMNLSTARAGSRHKEIFVKKISGSGKVKLALQFLFETLLLSLVSLVVAVILVKLAVPLVNDLLNTELNIPFNLYAIVTLLGIAFFTGLVAGAYPALYLSAIMPKRIMQGTGQRSGFKRISLRQTLVTLQFAVSIFFVSCTLLVSNQLTYLKSRDTGFRSENIIKLTTLGKLKEKAVELKKELLKNPTIGNVTISFTDLTNWGNSGPIEWEGKDKADLTEVGYNWVDADFLNTFQLRMKEGRFFSNDFSSDQSNAFVLNEKAVSVLKLKDPVGMKVKSWFGVEGTIIGIIEDFHTTSMHEELGPIVLLPASQSNYMFIGIDGRDIAGTLRFIDQKVKEFVPDDPFDYQFLEDHLHYLYQVEALTGRIATTLSVLAIFISCLGLWGLALSTLGQRTKEIGIRKVNGAPLSGIWIMLNKDFVKWIAIAFILATPFAWYAMRQWLKSFAYKTELSWWIFLLAGLLALGIALLTVSWQSWKAATRNPVEALRYE
ncbi:MAG: ABC transporter permease [Mangrovibacterium sp.]